MGKASVCGPVGILWFAGFALAGCASAPAVSPMAAAPMFTLNTPVEKIAADDRGKEVLDRDLPGLMGSSSYLLFDDMSLSQIATLSSGKLTKSKLDVVEADLSVISR